MWQADLTKSVYNIGFREEVIDYDSIINIGIILSLDFDPIVEEWLLDIFLSFFFRGILVFFFFEIWSYSIWSPEEFRRSSISLNLIEWSESCWMFYFGVEL